MKGIRRRDKSVGRRIENETKDKLYEIFTKNVMEHESNEKKGLIMREEYLGEDLFMWRHTDYFRYISATLDLPT